MHSDENNSFLSHFFFSGARLKSEIGTQLGFDILSIPARHELKNVAGPDFQTSVSLLNQLKQELLPRNS